MSYDPIADTEINPGKPPKSSIFYRLRDNADSAKDAGENAILEQFIQTAGTGTWVKTPGYQDYDTVLGIATGAGGSGANAYSGAAVVRNAGGGSGGAFGFFAIPYGLCPAALGWVVGAGGVAAAARNANGADPGTPGGDSSIIGTTGDLFALIARGGLGGLADAAGATIANVAGGNPRFRVRQTPTTRYFDSLVDAYVGGYGAGVNGVNSLVGGVGWFGAGGGGSAGGTTAIVTREGGPSRFSGAGGDGVASNTGVIVGGNGVAPGGGGGGAFGYSTATSAQGGNGANGQIEIYILRGWHPALFSNRFE